MATTQTVNGIHITTGDASNEHLIGNNKRIAFLPRRRKSGKDFMLGAEGNDTIYGREESDTIQGNQGNDRLFGEDGLDLLYGQQGNDRLYGGKGNDRLYGDLAPIFGNIYQDVTDRTYVGRIDAFPAGRDLLYGGDGSDMLSGGSFNDTLYGQKGRDYLDGDEGDDLLVGGSWDDNSRDDLSGGYGNDLLLGGPGNDYLGYDVGFERGRDTLVGGSGNDILSGGQVEGNIFHFNSPNEGIDRITDFNRDSLRTGKIDKIQVNRSNFPTLLGFRYDSATGQLSYDGTHFVTIQEERNVSANFNPRSDIVFVDFFL
jgi:Ca2+-binding RTX toxin-like protein